MIGKLRKAGMNIVRMNFSHGSYEVHTSIPYDKSPMLRVKYHQSVIDHTRAAESEEEGRPLAIALDTKGPEIRTGNTVGDVDIPISAGHEMIITTDEECPLP
jgi:pyruvate kinase